MMKLYSAFNDLCATFIAPIANLWARIYLGWYVFFADGWQKVQDMEETIELFDPEEDGEFVISFLPEGFSPELLAYMATIGELVLPVLLILGLFTRFSALGLLVMAAVIQYGVFEDPQHILWMTIFALLVGYGGGKLSLDNLLLKLKK